MWKTKTSVPLEWRTTSIQRVNGLDDLKNILQLDTWGYVTFNTKLHGAITDQGDKRRRIQQATMVNFL